MTNEAATDIRQWLVSARSRGELLATRARVPGIELVMVGVPAGYSAEEVESWLKDLMGMSLETASTETGERPIPALLHHLLTGLIFSHSELWDRGGNAAPTSMAFVRTANEVAFGWVNGPNPELWIDDHPAHVEWVRIRDPEGREACALAIDPAHRIRVHFGFGDPGMVVASVDGVWVPEASALDAAASADVVATRGPSAISRAVGARATPAPAEGASAELAPTAFDPPPPPRAAEGDGWTVVYEGDPLAPRAGDSQRRPWWSGVAQWITRSKRPAAAEATAATDTIPPTPESADLTAQTAPVTTWIATPDESGHLQLAPLAPEEPAPAPPAPAVAPPAIQVESAHLENPTVRRPHEVAAHLAVPPRATSIESSPAPIVPATSAAAPTAQPRPAATPQSAASPRPAPAARATPTVLPDAPIPAAIESAPTPASIPGDEVETGLLSTPSRAPRRVRTLDWSEPATEIARPLWTRPWAWGGAVVLLFLVGWLLGNQNEHANDEPSGFTRAMRAIGIGGARFETRVTSEPAGAWIAIDGRDVARRTPATIELTPGMHQIGLSLPDLGAATWEVRGVRGDHAQLDADLAGSLTVYGDGAIPVAVTVDGVPRGLAPVTVDSLEPGTHEVRFSGPGLQPWGRTVQVKIHDTAQIAARAVTSPATGVLEVRAQWTDTEGSEPLKDATVWIDGEKRGATPLSLELPRGPHSVRIEGRGETSAVQVIDLPGGNQRFANFELGLGVERPTLTVLGTPIHVRAEEPAVISASLQGAHPTEIREMWLNVRQPDGAWRRTPMMMMSAPGGLVGTAVLASSMLDAQGKTSYYVSASSQQGDDYFSEVQIATLAGAAVPGRK